MDRHTLRRWRNWLLAGLGGLALLVWLTVPEVRDQVQRAVTLLRRGDVEALRDYVTSFGAWAPVVSAALMVLQAVLAPLPAFLLAFVNGLAFGVFWGSLLSLSSATLAAAVCFGISRAVGRGPVEALVGSANLERADRWLASRGAWVVLVARLVPVISFDVVSYAAGLTRMRLAPFLLATAVGAAPATVAYSWLGQHAPQYVTLLLVVFAVIVAGTLVGALLRRRGRQQGAGR